MLLPTFFIGLPTIFVHQCSSHLSMLFLSCFKSLCTQSQPHIIHLAWGNNICVLHGEALQTFTSWKLLQIIFKKLWLQFLIRNVLSSLSNMFFRLTPFLCMKVTPSSSLVVLAIILRPDCPAMFVQDGSVNSFWPDGNAKLFLQHLIFT